MRLPPDERRGCSVCGGGLAHPDARWCAEHAPRFEFAAPSRFPAAEVERRAWSRDEPPADATRALFAAERDVREACERTLRRLGAPRGFVEMMRQMRIAALARRRGKR